LIVVGGSRFVARATTCEPRAADHEQRNEHRITLHQTPGDDHAGHVGHRVVRHHGLSAVAGERSAQRRLPDDPGSGSAAGGQPGNNGLGHRDAAREAVHHDRRHRFDDVVERAGPDRHHHPVLARPLHRRCRPGRASGHRQSGPAAAAPDADAARVPEGEPGRPAGHLSVAVVADPAALRRRRVRADQPGPADLHDQRRGPGPGVRLAEVRGPRPGGSARAGRPRHRHRRGAERRRAGQREQADRDALRPAPVVRRPGHRPAHRRRRLSTVDRHLPQRLAGEARAARPCHRQRADRQGGVLVQRRARGDPGHSVSPVPTPSRSSMRSARCCRSSAKSCRAR